MSKARHFSTMTKDEIRQLVAEVEEVTIQVTDKMGIGALSEMGSHNLYMAIREMISSEVMKAKIAMIERNNEA